MSIRLAAATAALVLATSTLAFAAGMGPTKFTLHPQNHSGETGEVMMTQDGDNVVVNVTTTNAPADAQPIHIHQGTCDALNPKPQYPLTTLQKGTSTTTLKNMTLAQLETGDFAINIHHSTSDVPTYYACGNIPKMKM
jgi:CHRD domain-containing protein